MVVLDSGKILRQLVDIERRSRQFAAGLPQEEVKLFWEGILFGVAGIGAIAPLGEIREILNVPTEITKIPGTRDWVLGMANIRGSLLPIFDLQLFLGSAPVPIGRRSRVLVIDHEGLFAGLLVGDVQGMRHFSDEQLVEVPVLAESIIPFVEKAYELDGTVRPVFSMSVLAQSAEFRVAAL